MSEKCEINKCNNCSDALLNEMQKVMIKNHELQAKVDELEKKLKIAKEELERYDLKRHWDTTIIQPDKDIE